MSEAAATTRRFDEPDELRESVVIGDEPHVSIHFLGADQYAST